ncbi:MAG TPA: ABC-type transport auxiliary lipoprotein family protein [Anaeromyxobacter sp.]
MNAPKPILPAAALLAASVACLPAGLKPSAPDLYALDPAVARPEAAAAEAPVPVAVAAPRAAPGLEGRGIVYVQREHELRYFARSAWVDSPARMLAPLLSRALEADGAFRVVAGPGGEPARLRLETDLLRLQHEFTARPSRVRLVLRARLVDAGTRRSLGEREIEIVEPAPSDDPYGGVLAANAAAARAVSEVAAGCATWARGTPSATAERSARRSE